MAEVAERLAHLEARCREVGRGAGRPRVAVALRRPHVDDVPALADLGVDELVIVETPPVDPGLAAAWVSALADRWLK